MVTTEEIDRDIETLEQNKRELRPIANQRIPQRRFGSGVSRKTQQDVLRQKQDAERGIDNLNKQQEDLKKSRRELVEFQEAQAAEGERRQRIAVANKLLKRGKKAEAFQSLTREERAQLRLEEEAPKEFIIEGTQEAQRLEPVRIIDTDRGSLEIRGEGAFEGTAQERIREFAPELIRVEDVQNNEVSKIDFYSSKVNKVLTKKIGGERGVSASQVLESPILFARKGSEFAAFLTKDISFIPLITGRAKVSGVSDRAVFKEFQRKNIERSVFLGGISAVSVALPVTSGAFTTAFFAEGVRGFTDVTNTPLNRVLYGSQSVLSIGAPAFSATKSFLNAPAYKIKVAPKKFITSSDLIRIPSDQSKNIIATFKLKTSFRDGGTIIVRNKDIIKNILRVVNPKFKNPSLNVHGQFIPQKPRTILTEGLLQINDKGKIVNAFTVTKNIFPRRSKEVLNFLRGTTVAKEITGKQIQKGNVPALNKLLQSLQASYTTNPSKNLLLTKSKLSFGSVKSASIGLKQSGFNQRKAILLSRIQAKPKSNQLSEIERFKVNTAVRSQRKDLGVIKSDVNVFNQKDLSSFIPRGSVGKSVKGSTTRTIQKQALKDIIKVVETQKAASIPKLNFAATKVGQTSKTQTREVVINRLSASQIQSSQTRQAQRQQPRQVTRVLTRSVQKATPRTTTRTIARTTPRLINRQLQRTTPRIILRTVQRFPPRINPPRSFRVPRPPRPKGQLPPLIRLNINPKKGKKSRRDEGAPFNFPSYTPTLTSKLFGIRKKVTPKTINIIKTSRFTGLENRPILIR